MEHYDAFGDCELIEFVRGTTANLPAFVFFRPHARQLIVSISGSASALHALYDVWVVKMPHPSGLGSVHSGFWALYCGMKGQLMERIRHEIAQRSPVELILTGHSMGGSLAYLLLLDLLAEELPRESSMLSKVGLRIAVFGAPRTGDRRLVNYFHSLVQQCRDKFGLDDAFFREYSVQGYNDGVPALPPPAMGYSHFCRTPLFTGGGRLYRSPDANHSQVMLYPPEDAMEIFPKGGHNYYNRRDLESFRKRTGWLAEADVEKAGWESRYQAAASRDSSQRFASC